MAFPKTIVDRQAIAEMAQSKLSWASVVCGATGYPFISIEHKQETSRISRTGRLLMWDTKDFNTPTILNRIPAKPREIERWETLHRCSVDPILSGPGWIVLAAYELVDLANKWLRKEKPYDKDTTADRTDEQE